MYNCIIFDMDGTLIDSYEGIFRAYQWTMEKLGEPFKGDILVKRAIGAPLPYVFEKICKMPIEKTKKAIELYRGYYEKRGKKQAKAYEGIERALQQLKKEGKFLGVATLKNKKFAVEILRDTGLSSYFNIVCGMDEEDKLTKAELIDQCRIAAGAEKEETILVGDSEFDFSGAKEAGVSFLAVTYGFGYHTPEELKKENVSLVAAKALDIPRLLIGRL